MQLIQSEAECYLVIRNNVKLHKKENSRMTCTEWQNLGENFTDIGYIHIHISSFSKEDGSCEHLYKLHTDIRMLKTFWFLTAFQCKSHFAFWPIIVLDFLKIKGERETMFWKSAHKFVWSRFMATFLNSIQTVVHKHFVLKTPKIFCFRGVVSAYIWKLENNTKYF